MPTARRGGGYSAAGLDGEGVWIRPPFFWEIWLRQPAATWGGKNKIHPETWLVLGYGLRLAEHPGVVSLRCWVPAMPIATRCAPLVVAAVPVVPPGVVACPPVVSLHWVTLLPPRASRVNGCQLNPSFQTGNFPPCSPARTIPGAAMLWMAMG